MSTTPSLKSSIALFAPTLEKRIAENPKDIATLYRLLEVYRKTGALEDIRRIAKLWRQTEPQNTEDILLAKLLLGEALAPFSFKETHPCPFWVIDDFLSDQERDTLLQFGTENAERFEQASYDAFDENGNRTRKINKEYRDQLCLNASDDIESLLESAILPLVDEAKKRFGMPFESIFRHNMEVLLTGHKQHGQAHSDRKKNSTKPMGSKIIFLYYMYQKPKAFDGGDLLLFDTDFPNDTHVEAYTRISPTDNRLVAFPACFYHSISEVHLESNELVKGRFSIPFWVQLQ